MYLCRDKIPRRDFGRRQRRWPEGHDARPNDTTSESGVYPDDQSIIAAFAGARYG